MRYQAPTGSIQQRPKYRMKIVMSTRQLAYVTSISLEQILIFGPGIKSENPIPIGSSYIDSMLDSCFESWTQTITWRVLIGLRNHLSETIDNCYKTHVSYPKFVWYHFSIRANPFHRVCLFDFIDICNEQELISGCCSGKVFKNLSIQLNVRLTY